MSETETEDEREANVHLEAIESAKDDKDDLKRLRKREDEQWQMAKKLVRMCKELKKDDVDLKDLSNQMLAKAKELRTSCKDSKQELFQLLKEKRQDIRSHREEIKRIEEGDKKEKAKATANTAELLREQRATKADDESAVENKVNRAAYYISDYNPLAYSALTFHATITSSLAEMMVSEECNPTYQVAEWMVFLFATIGLVRLVYRANEYLDDDKWGIFNAIVSQWAVFLVLLLSTTSFIPLQCYTGSSAWPKWIASALLLVLPFLGFKLSATSQALNSAENGTPTSRDLTPKSYDEENGPLMDNSD